jgi:hypothetical protein
MERCLETQVMDHNESKVDVYKAYENFCIDKRLAKESMETFGRRLKNDYGVQQGRERRNNVQTRVWKYVKLRQWKTVQDEDQDTFD